MDGSDAPWNSSFFLYLLEERVFWSIFGSQDGSSQDISSFLLYLEALFSRSRFGSQDRSSFFEVHFHSACDEPLIRRFFLIVIEYVPRHPNVVADALSQMSQGDDFHSIINIPEYFKNKYLEDRDFSNALTSSMPTPSE